MSEMSDSASSNQQPSISGREDHDRTDKSRLDIGDGVEESDVDEQHGLDDSHTQP